MISKLYSVFDSKAGTFDLINMYNNAQQAIRSFGTACNDPSSNFYKFAEDFALYEIGSFDNVSGVLTYNAPVCVINAINVSREHNEYYAARNFSDIAV